MNNRKTPWSVTGISTELLIHAIRSVWHSVLSFGLHRIYIKFWRKTILCRSNTWLQWIGHRQLQDETRIIQVLVFGARYIKDLTTFSSRIRQSLINRYVEKVHSRMPNDKMNPTSVLSSEPKFTASYNHLNQWRFNKNVWLRDVKLTVSCFHYWYTVKLSYETKLLADVNCRNVLVAK